MGFLSSDTTLDWTNTKKVARQVQTYGIEQLRVLWRKNKDRHSDAVLWGDEVEGILVSFDDVQKRAKPLPSAHHLIEQLNQEGERMKLNDKLGPPRPCFLPELSSFNLETTPGKPWGIDSSDIIDVERNMKWRRALINNQMAEKDCFLTLASFPQLGARRSRTVCEASRGDLHRSQYIADDLVSAHVKHQALAANIRSRRGRKVQLNVPVFRDENTPWPFYDPTVNYDLHRWAEDDEVRSGAVKEGCIYMDSTAFGGCCSLQVTVQTYDVKQARYLYDQLLPLGPVMLALTAANPIAKGFLCQTDVRWQQLSAAVDERTAEELGEKVSFSKIHHADSVAEPERHSPKPLCENRWKIPKARFASNSTYISQDPRRGDEYLDPALLFDEELKQKLLDDGMDDLLATHFAHLFIRDPLVVFAASLERLELDKTDHFELLQSTNWQTVRFKPPPSPTSPAVGWRVEFRSMEVQMTDFENAAFAVFMVLLSQTILHFNLNFYIPIPKIDENMATAHRCDAVLKERFHFRTYPLSGPAYAPSSSSEPSVTDEGSVSSDGFSMADEAAQAVNGSPVQSQATSSFPPSPPTGSVEKEYEAMSVNEIVNGQSSSRGGFPGLIPLVEQYVATRDYDLAAQETIQKYLKLIEKRANGSLWTTARWCRHFVQHHPRYARDSIVDDEVAYDLLQAVKEITELEHRSELAQALLGEKDLLV